MNVAAEECTSSHGSETHQASTDDVSGRDYCDEDEALAMAYSIAAALEASTASLSHASGDKEPLALLAEAGHVVCGFVSVSQTSPRHKSAVSHLADAAAALAMACGKNAAVTRQADEAAAWNYLAWACSRAGRPHPEVFGLPNVVACEAVSRRVWEAFGAAAKRPRDSSPRAHKLAQDAFPLLWIPNWLTQHEASTLIGAADALRLWESSPLANEVAASALRPRTSETAVLDHNRLEQGPNDVIAAVRKQAADFCGLPVEYVEPLQMVRYSPGQHYKAHVDWGGPEDPSLWVAGQRVATVLVYLNDVPCNLTGGSTCFTQLGERSTDSLRITPVCGAAIAWPNVDASGMPLFQTEHEAEPLRPKTRSTSHENGDMQKSTTEEFAVKVALNIWIRDRPVPSCYSM